jgi:hypothetical protein
MSTHSNIGIVNDDGSLTYIYCHSDGYPSWNGRILLEHYTDPKKIKELMALGNISSLGANIGRKHDFDNYEVSRKNNWTRAYMRDRGEKGQEARTVKPKQPGNDTPFCVCEEEFFYVFKDGVWWMSDGGELQPLTPQMCVEE